MQRRGFRRTVRGHTTKFFAAAQIRRSEANRNAAFMRQRAALSKKSVVRPQFMRAYFDPG